MNNWISNLLSGGVKVKGLAIVGLLMAAGTAYTALADGKPETQPDWGTLGVAASACFAALFARQNGKTSEDVGVK